MEIQKYLFHFCTSTCGGINFRHMNCEILIYRHKKEQEVNVNEKEVYC